MRRRVQLFIEDHKVDLDDDALVLLNFATADLYNPATIRNSFSREITIPGTPANDDVFGCFFRADRRLGAASSPTPLRGASLRSGLRSTTLSWQGNGEVAATGDNVTLNLGALVDSVDRTGETATISGDFYLSCVQNSITSTQHMVSGRRLYGNVGFGSVFFVQAIGYDVDGNKVAASDVQVLRWWTALTPSDLATFVGYTPDPLNTTLVAVDDSAASWDVQTGAVPSPHQEYRRDTALSFSLTATALKRVEILVTYGKFDTSNGNLSAFSHASGNGPVLNEDGGSVLHVFEYMGIFDVTPGDTPPGPDPPDPPAPDPSPTGSGNYRQNFDPSIRAAFVLYSDGDNVLMNGYAKLTDVVETGMVHSYRLSLYGGLGSFLYNLSTRADGNKMTLADLDFGGGEGELDFDITKEAVADAWARLQGDTSKPEMWDIINFAPCYNGIPEGEFDPSKAVCDPLDIGFPRSVTIPDGQGGNVTYDTTKGQGYALLDFPKEVNEWAAKDLRSYLQRPVVSVWKILEACADPYNNGGWEVDITDLSANWAYKDMWLTRPLLPFLGTFKQSSGDMTATPTTPASTGPVLVSIALADVTLGTEVTLSVTFGLRANLSTAPGQTTMFTRKTSGTAGYEYQSVYFIQLVGYASDNSVVAASPVTIFGPRLNFVSDLAQFAADCGYSPVLPGGQTAEYEASTGFDPGSMTGSGTAYNTRGVFFLETAGTNMASAKVLVTRYTIDWNPLSGDILSVSNLATLYTDTTTAGTAYVESTSLATGASVSATAVSTSTLRSGAHITKQMLLSTSQSPAEYLVSLCKAFGLYLVADPTRKRITILRRSAFYQNVVTDLTGRIDRSHEITMQALTYNAKWYELRHESVGGAFEKEYEETEGIQYGIQRVDTGYDFDAEVKDILEGGVLRSCAAVRDRAAYWYTHFGVAGFLPAPLAEPPGGSYTLWDSAGNALETPINPGATSATPFDANYPGYDNAPSRAEFRDAADKALDGSDVLLVYGGVDVLEYFNLSDDLPAMDALIGKPCWYVALNAQGVDTPRFSRYVTLADLQDGKPTVIHSLDFGIPRAVAIPDLTYKSYTIYIRAWQKFIRDRFDTNNKVLRCRVSLEGLQVGTELLRRFWWWRGSLWVLNAIENYSLTTYDTAECEFVQVRDIDNYVSQY